MTYAEQKTVELMPRERIVAVVPEPFDGPGWNTPVMVYIATNDGRLREECLQPDEQTPQMRALYHVGEAMCKALVAAVPQRRPAKVDRTALEVGSPKFSKSDYA